MRNKIVPLAVLIALAIQCGFATADTTDEMSTDYRFSEPSRGTFVKGRGLGLSGGFGAGGGPGEPAWTRQYIDKLVAAAINGDALTRAATDVANETRKELGKTNDPEVQFVFVKPAQWKTQTAEKQLAGKFGLTVEPTVNFNGNELRLNLRLRFSRSIELEVVRAIAKKYSEAISPELKKISQQWFDDNFQPALAAAQKARDESESAVNQLENNRQHLQLRSYEELPYEKVADHLADLQRQQLTLKLSLVGIEAKQEEIEKQVKRAQLRLKDQAADSAKPAGADEMVATLKQLVALREKNLDRLKELNRAGMAASASDVDEAAARALEAKIQLLSLLGKKQSQVSSEQVDSLNNELTRLAIDRSESNAKLQYLEKSREDVQQRIAERSSLDQEIKHIDEALPLEKQKLRTAEARVKELEEAKATFQPIDLTRNDG